MEVFLEHLLAQFRAQKAIHFPVSYLNARGHAALLQSGDHHVFANLFAELGPVVAVLAQGGGKVFQAHAILAGDAGQGLVEAGVVDLDTAPFGQLQLQALQHHAIEHLLAHHRRGRQLLAFFLKLQGDGVDSLIQFAGHDGAVVNHGDNAVKHLHLGLAPGRHYQHGHGQQAKQGVSGMQRATCSVQRSINHTVSCIPECCAPAGNPPGRQSRPGRSSGSGTRWCCPPRGCRRRCHPPARAG